MKSGVIAVAVAGAVVLCGTTYAFLRGKEAPEAPVSVAAAEPNAPAAGCPCCGGQDCPTGCAAADSPAVVQVDDLADSPEKYPGEVTLRAVIARVNRSQGVMAVIDAREFESCGQVNCARHYLPVKCSGTLPEPKTVIEITGKVAKAEKGLVFEASRVEAKR